MTTHTCERCADRQPGGRKLCHDQHIDLALQLHGDDPNHHDFLGWVAKAHAQLVAEDHARVQHNREWSERNARQMRQLRASERLAWIVVPLVALAVMFVFAAFTGANNSPDSGGSYDDHLSRGVGE
jgi:hypothetical protein